MPAPKRVLVTDDSGFARAQLKDLLGAHGFDVVGEAANATQAIELYGLLRPDIVTMDLAMPGGTGLDAIVALRALYPACKIVLITAVREPFAIRDLAKLDVPIVPKPVRWPELERALFHG